MRCQKCRKKVKKITAVLQSSKAAWLCDECVKKIGGVSKPNNNGN